MFPSGYRACLRTASRPRWNWNEAKNTIGKRSSSSISHRSQVWTRRDFVAAATGLTLFGGFITYQISRQPTLKLDAPPSVAEKKVKLSSQHDQVMQFWDRPGVYLWGSNNGRVAAPDSNDAFIKSPRRVPFFDGFVLRDLQISQDMGAAVTDTGDILQWGTGFSSDCREPVVTFAGKNIKKIGLSQDRIVALSSSGKVFSIPFSKEEQNLFSKPTEPSSMPFSSGSESKTSYRNLTPTLGSWESVVDIAVGLEHTVMLTSAGRVFTAACASYMFPDKGQLGVSGMAWDAKPKPYDKPMEVKHLEKINVTQIAAGNFHSVVADKEGNIYAWGDNTKGQLGKEFNEDGYPTPTVVPLKSFYKPGIKAKLQKIYAGGFNTYFTMEAEIPNEDFRKPSTKIFDVFACGHGVVGTLGTGLWVHAQGTPQKVKNISGLIEYSEKTKGLVPINISYLTVGATHTAAVMSNLANVSASNSKETDINFGNDILFFGGNEFYQLGNGKRNNVNVPIYVPPMDSVGDSALGNRMDHRFQIVPEKKVQILDQNLKKKSVKIEQRVVAGRGLSGCYAKAC